MIDPVVRLATADDAAELAELETAARAALVEARGGERWLTEYPRLGHAWTARIAAGGVFVALVDDVPVGFLTIDVAVPVATVEQVFVHPEARELGFGDALLGAAVVAARTAGAVWLEGHTLPGDRNIKNLYERARITARLITVSTRL